jgi:hypothetical protein
VAITHLVVLVTTSMILAHPDDEVQHGHKGPNRIRIATEHHVTEPNVVECCHMASRHAGEG